MLIEENVREAVREVFEEIPKAEGLKQFKVSLEEVPAFSFAFTTSLPETLKVEEANSERVGFCSEISEALLSMWVWEVSP